MKLPLLLLLVLLLLLDLQSSCLPVIRSLIN